MTTERINIVVVLRKLGTAGLNVLSKTFDRLKRGAVALGKALLGMAVAGTAAAFAFTKLVKRGGEAINVQRAFNRIGGQGVGAMQALRKATQGLISDLDLMTGFNRAVTLGSAANIEQFAELSKTAITLGRALRVDAGFALESLSLGIGRQSRLILDNLGLIVSIEEANKKYAASLKITVKELTEADRREAFRTAALESARAKIEELGEVQLNAADAVKRLQIGFTNLLDKMAAKLAGSEKITEFFTGLADVVDNLTTLIDSGQVREAFQALGAIAGNAFAIGFLEAMKVVERGIKLLAAKLRRDHPFLFGPTSGTRARQALGLTQFADPQGVSQRPGAPPIPRAAPAEASLLDRLIGERRDALLAAGEKLIAGAAAVEAAADKLKGAAEVITTAKAPLSLGELLDIEAIGGAPRGLAGIAGRGGGGIGGPRIPVGPALPTPEFIGIFRQWIDLQEMARGIIQATLTPQERYTKELANLELLFNSKLLTTEQYRRAIEALDESMKKASISAEQLAVAAIQSFSAIIQAIVGGGGTAGIFGAILGTIGGVVGIANPVLGAALGAGGALISSLGRDRTPKVIVDSFGPEAVRQQQAIRQIPDIQITIIDPRRNVREVLAELNDLEARDGVARVPVILGGRG